MTEMYQQAQPPVSSPPTAGDSPAASAGQASYEGAAPTYAPVPGQVPAAPPQVTQAQMPTPMQAMPQVHEWAPQGQEWRMIVTTTPGIAGYRITRYLGVVAAEVVLGTSLTKDIAAQVKGFVGGRSEAYEREVRHARQQAMQDMVEIATQMQAQAVIGTSFDYTSVNGLVMVTATGTAVQVEFE